MPHLLLYNPNTNTNITHDIQITAESLLPSWTITAQTAHEGPRYIANASDLKQASNVTKHTITKEFERHYDAILIACFGDPAVSEIRNTLTIPVFGMAEAAFSICSKETSSFSILTGGDEWPPLLKKLSQDTGYNTKIDTISTIPTFGEQAQNSPNHTLNALEKTAHILEKTYKTPHILLGGTGLAPFHNALSSRTSLPVTCSLRASLHAVSEHFE